MTSTEAPAAAPARIAAPDGLRGLAAVGVFAFHLTWRAPVLFDSGRPVTGHLDTGVEIFFVLSALLVFGPFADALERGKARPSIGKYLVKRAVRVWPAYLAVLAVIIVFGPAALDGVDGVVKHASLSYLYFEDRGGTGLPVAWTLVVQMSFYVFVPVAAVLLARMPGRQRAVVFSLVCIAGGAYAQHLVAFDLDTPRWVRVLPPAMLSLGAGMLMVTALRDPSPTSRIARAVRTAAGHPGVLLAVALASFVVLVVFIRADTDLGRRAGDRFAKELLQAVIASCLVLSVAPGVPRTDRWNRFLGRSPLPWLGAVSYGLFLWHIPVLKWLRPWAGDEHITVAVGGWIAALVVSLALATLTWQFVEQPVLRAADHRLRRSSRGAPSVPERSSADRPRS